MSTPEAFKPTRKLFALVHLSVLLGEWTYLKRIVIVAGLLEAMDGVGSISRLP